MRSSGVPVDVRAAIWLAGLLTRDPQSRLHLEAWWYYNAGVPGARRELLGEAVRTVRDADRSKPRPAAYRLRRVAGSPWLILALLACAAVLLTLLSDGLPETRAVLRPSPDRVVLLSARSSFGSRALGVLSSRVAVWPRYQQSLDAFAVYIWQKEDDGSLTGRVDPAFFDLLGVEPASGRCFGRDLPCPACALTADPAEIGKVLYLGGRPYQVIGAVPPEFRFGSVKPRHWVPLNPESVPHRVGVIGRLRAGVTETRAQHDLGADVTGVGYLRWEALLFYAMTMLLALGIACLRVAHDRTFWAHFSAPLRSTWRFWLFLVVKAAAAMALIAVAAIELRYGMLPSTTGARAAFFVLVGAWPMLILFGGALWVCWADQRTRCRTCLRRLEQPVHMGVLGASMFDPTGVESVCPSGHGALYVPDLPDRDVAWISLDKFFSAPTA